MKGSLANILTIARREFLWRGRGRTYIVSTILLVVIAVGVALAPVVIRYFAEQNGPQKVALYMGSTTMSIDPAAALDRALNNSTGSSGSGASTGTPGGANANAKPAYVVVPVTDLAAARREVADGKIAAALAIGRATSGELTFDLYTKDADFDRTPQVARTAVLSLAIQDRLERLGIAPSDQAALFAPATIELRTADPAAADGSGGPKTATEFASDYVVGFALTIFIYMAIMLYGQWVAMSVAEEKNSRVMELVLGAASPFQLLSGKVLGVGALGLLQFAIVFVPASLAIVFQDRISAFVLGGSATSDLPTGLSLDLLAVFGVLFVLGFAMYAVLYAGAASLVSRQEDVNQVVAPLTILSTVGYLMAAWAGTGLVDLASPLMRAVSFFPLVSPYLILTRIGLHQITPLEVVLAVALLLVTIVVALWVAARIYRVGVLMYGQKPGLRTMFHAFRTAGA